MKVSFFEKLKAFLVVNRFEFTPVSEGIILSFMILNLGSFKELISIPVILAFITYNIATYWGGAINVYFDYNFDKKSPTKVRLTKAIDVLGKPFVRKMLVVEFLLFSLSGFLLSYFTKNYNLLILLIIGTFFTMAYSIEPLRFKRRGILNSISLFLIIMFLPPLYGWLTLNSSLSVPVFLMILGLAFVQYGNGLYYTAADYTEDKADGIITPPVQMGVLKAVKVSLLLVMLGGILLVYGYSNLEYLNTSGLILTTLGQLVPFLGILQLLVKSKNDTTVMETLIKRYEMRIPVWVAISSFSILFSNVFFMIYR
ncbi:UbiA prenyltransferase family protein [Ruminiclostridium sufflavum DSM 19573]|uniref:UbiA prenyltransferase family protein n=1 Tax=Ruminiclostridium sufflavum DSM 19573 TaxID=1121337 RepID=A0A318XMV3_9FIRM|nr:UbiA family prenyltransferase [Ruminiclostridium sufflavum]PYG88028.1 UbiA prenyltransferase family protein [Ruminiclostridium sufflavum DSM 19573]